MNLNLNVDAFVSKLRNTVSQVAYQVNSSVSTIIPGNPVHRDYEVLKKRCICGSPGFVWQVHDAIKRDSASIKASLKDAIGSNLKNHSISQPELKNVKQDTQLISNTTNKQLYTTFVFDKSQLDTISNKTQREACLEHIKKGVQQLTRLRHPSILIVHHPLEESRSSLAFVTEHVFGNLSSILEQQQQSNNDSLVPESYSNSNLLDIESDSATIFDNQTLIDSCELDIVQIKAGLLQICDGFRFLHSSANLLHRNLCLENVFVDSNNTWKIAGFEFCCQPASTFSSTQQEGNAIVDLMLEDLSESTPVLITNFPSLQTIHKNGLHPSIVPNWSCSAPEHSNNELVTTAADIYSLGVISCALLGEYTLKSYKNINLTYEFGLISDTYKRGIRIRELAEVIPASIRSQIIKFCSINIESRPSLSEFQTMNIFLDPQVQAIRDLDAQVAWDRLKKIDFFNHLRHILPKFSRQLKVNRLARPLFNEMINLDMMPHVLPNILIIIKDSNSLEFETKLLPNLRQAFRVLEPRTVPLMILENLIYMFEKSQKNLSTLQDLAFEQIQYLLAMDAQLQDKCFTVLPIIKKYIDDKSMKKIISTLGEVCNKTSSLSLQVKCLDCLASLVDVVERWTFVENLLPLLVDIPSFSPDVIISVVKIIKTVIENPNVEPTKEIIAKKILPFLIPLTVEKDLDASQFQVVMTLVRNLLIKIEKEHKATYRKNSTNLSSPLVLEKRTI